MSRRVLVTGGASGIGAATVARFQEEGCRVASLDLDGAGGADCMAVQEDHDLANDLLFGPAFGDAPGANFANPDNFA